MEDQNFIAEFSIGKHITKKALRKGCLTLHVRECILAKRGKSTMLGLLTTIGSMWIRPSLPFQVVAVGRGLPFHCYVEGFFFDRRWHNKSEVPGALF